jgi:polyphosphate kinase
MERNLRERVEVAVPIKDPAHVRQLEDILALYWADTAKSRWMRADGSYARATVPSGETPFNVQEWLARRAESPDLAAPPMPRIFPERVPAPERPAEAEAR